MQQEVNYIEHLKNVNARFYDDKLITSSHVAVYNSLFQFWNKSFFDTDLAINRDSVMKQAKIGSVNTYLKCLKELEIQGYLKYNPSHNPLIGSIVNLFRFDTTHDIVVIKSDTSIDTTPDKALIPYINIKTLKPKTLKLINENAPIIDKYLEYWLIETETLKPKKEKKEEINYDRIFNFFIETTGKRIKLFGDKEKSQLSARLKDGYTYEDIELGIKNCFNDSYHKDSNHKYLTLEFILRQDKLSKFVSLKSENNESTKIKYVRVRMGLAAIEMKEEDFEKALREGTLNCDNPIIEKRYEK
jgi:uncharacterized phage protein (TIGR02220 family)